MLSNILCDLKKKSGFDITMRISMSVNAPPTRKKELK